MRIKIIALLLVSMCAFVATAAPKRIRNKKPQKIVTVEQIASAVDSLIAPMDSCDNTDKVANLMKTLPTKFDKSALSALYQQRISASSEAEDAEALAMACRAVIAMADTASLPMAYQGMAQVYASRNDSSRLQAILEEFSAFSEEVSGDPYAGMIAEMMKEYDDILHPVPFIDKVRGTWVSYDRINNRTLNYPYIIFDINNLDNEGLRLKNIPSFTPLNIDWKLVKMMTSQIVGGCLLYTSPSPRDS